MLENKEERLFGVKDVPVLRPTTQEFQDPLSYIRSVRHLGFASGIIKIIPPAEFQPPFCINKETFRFKTRLQPLCCVEGTTRTAKNYVDRIRIYFEMEGIKFTVPEIQGNQINLLKLRNEVEKITKNGLRVDWSSLCPVFGLSPQYGKSLLRLYEFYISRFEKFINPLENRDGCITVSDEQSSCSSIVLSDDDNDEYEVSLVSIKSYSPDESDYSPPKKRIKIKIKTSKPLLKNYQATPEIRSQYTIPIKDTPQSNQNSSQCCKACRNQHSFDIVHCTECEEPFHKTCAVPLSRSGWICISCIKTLGNQFGFQEHMRRHSWDEFQAFANGFMNSWFLSKNMDVYSKAAVEKEFWRLVGSPYDQITVQYGADLHSTKVGSGFPRKAEYPNDPYSHHPWNLNTFSSCKGSIFRAQRDVIPGIMAPWVYIGMVFSTFAWHAEDHYTYSINYNHYGAPKTWYGIPAADATKFEKAAKEILPELFESNPDLIYQLTTTISPKELIDRGVQVFGTDQEAGEFIITFPKAYHSGFNQGFNCAEAVNFAPADWIAVGNECIKIYSEHHKAPVFCHEDLLINAASDCQDQYEALL